MNIYRVDFSKSDNILTVWFLATNTKTLSDKIERFLRGYVNWNRPQFISANYFNKVTGSLR
jgi:hypothetical protein